MARVPPSSFWAEISLGTKCECARQDGKGEHSFRSPVTTPSGRKLLDVIWVLTSCVSTQTYEFALQICMETCEHKDGEVFYVCKAKRLGEKKKSNKDLVMVAVPKRLKWSLTSPDSWTRSLTMSTRGNVVSEGHADELTSATRMWNAQHSWAFRHSHESFSICAAGLETFASTVTPEGSPTTVSFGSLCQKAKLSKQGLILVLISPRCIQVHCNKSRSKNRLAISAFTKIPFEKQAPVVLPCEKQWPFTVHFDWNIPHPRGPIDLKFRNILLLQKDAVVC